VSHQPNTGHPLSLDGELQVLVGAGAGESEQLMLISVPHADGRVSLRAWSGLDWSRAPELLERDAVDLLADIERALRARRALSPEIGAVRDWLRVPAR